MKIWNLFDQSLAARVYLVLVYHDRISHFAALQGDEENERVSTVRVKSSGVREVFRGGLFGYILECIFSAFHHVILSSQCLVCCLSDE